MGCGIEHMSDRQFVYFTKNGKMVSTSIAKLSYVKKSSLPPPKKEVMFLVRSVCLSVRRITRKLVNGF